MGGRVQGGNVGRSVRARSWVGASGRAWAGEGVGGGVRTVGRVEEWVSGIF